MNKGFALPAIVVIIAVVILIGGGGYFFFLGDSETLISAPIQVSLEDAINTSLGTDSLDAINISNRTKTHVRGTYAADSDVKDFYAVYNNGWYIVGIEAGNISCQRARALNFPESFITDCDNTHLESKTVDEVVEDSSDGDEITVIGVININDGTLVSENSEINISNIGSNIDDGEVIVVTGTVVEEGGEITVVADEVEDFPNTSSSSSDNSTNTTTTEEETSSEPITEPQTTDVDNSDSSNTLDIDNSGVEVQIKS